MPLTVTTSPTSSSPSSEAYVLPEQRTAELPRQRTLALMRAGIPLSLIFDLAVPEPHSTDLYAWEAGSWV